VVAVLLGIIMWLVILVVLRSFIIAAEFVVFTAVMDDNGGGAWMLAVIAGPHCDIIIVGAVGNVAGRGDAATISTWFTVVIVVMSIVLCLIILGVVVVGTVIVVVGTVIIAVDVSVVVAVASSLSVGLVDHVG